MRVLFYHAARDWSGSARAFAAAARALHAREWEVTFVCAPGSAVEERVAGAGYDVAPSSMEGGWVTGAYRLRRILESRFVEVVFVHTPREHLIAAAATRLAERGAVVRRIPAGVPFRVGGPGRFARRLATTGYVFASEEERAAAHRYPAWALEPVVAELGVDPERYDDLRQVPRASLGAGAAARLIVAVYREPARARLATLLRTVAMLAPRHPELRLALVGRGSEAEEIRMHAAALGITKIVAHLGERDDHLGVLRAADIGWVVADGDEAAYACLDFMAMKIPVLAERGALPQHYLADGIAGILLPRSDAPATAALVASFLAHESQRTAMGGAGRVRVARDFVESEMVDGFERAALAARDRTRWIR